MVCCAWEVTNEAYCQAECAISPDNLQLIVFDTLALFINFVFISIVQ